MIKDRYVEPRRLLSLGLLAALDVRRAASAEHEPEDRRGQRGRSSSSRRRRSKVVTDQLQKEFEPRQQTISRAARRGCRPSRKRFSAMQAVMGEEERWELERADPGGPARAAAHGERVSRGSEHSPQRGAREVAARACCSEFRPTRAPQKYDLVSPTRCISAARSILRPQCIAALQKARAGAAVSHRPVARSRWERSASSPHVRDPARARGPVRL